MVANKFICSVVALLIWMSCNNESEELQGFPQSKKGLLSKSTELESAELSFSDNTKVDSTLKAYFSFLREVIDDESKLHKSDTRHKLNTVTDNLTSVTRIASSRSIGPYGVEYYYENIKNDYAKWKTWCVQNKHKLRWDPHEKRVIDIEFLSNLDLVDLVFDRYFSIIKMAIDDRYFPGTKDERQRFFDTYIFFEHMTGIAGTSRRESEPESIVREFLAQDYENWKTWYERNRINLKWDIRQMSLSISH